MPDHQAEHGPRAVVNDLANQFDEGYARDELAAYHKNGLGDRARLLLAFLRGQGLEGRTVLEIGSGIGALHLEMLKAGASRATGVDASPTNIAQAVALAEELGLADRVDERVGDFVHVAGDVPPADVVLLDRVVC